MRAFAVLFRLHTAEVLGLPAHAALFFGLPLLLLLTVALVFQHGHPFERRRVSLVAAGAAPARLAADASLVLEQARSEAAGRAGLDSGTVSAVLVAQADGWRVVVSERERLLGQGLLQALRPGAAPAPGLEVVPARRFGYVRYLFPGLLSYTLLLAGLFGVGHTLLRFRRNLFLKKLATTPLSRVTFVSALMASRVALVLLQVALLVLAAWLGIGLPLTWAAALWLLGLTLIGLLAFMGIGFALACAVTTEGALFDLINAAGVPLVFFSEIFFPVAELPWPLPAVAGALPTTLLVRLLRAVLLEGRCEVAALAPGVLGLIAWAALGFGVSVAAFRWLR